MKTLRVSTPEGLVLERPLAGAGSRFGAALIDMLVILLGLLTLLAIALIIATFDPTGATRLLLGMLAGGGLLLLISYQALIPMYWRGQTPGKLLFGLRTLSADGWPARPAQHLLRALVWPLDVLLPIPSPFGLLGIVSIVVSDSHQRLGDMVAGTVVVREGTRPLWAATTDAAPGPQPARSGLDLHPGLAARLGDDDRAFLGDLLARQGLDPQRRKVLFVAAARHYAARLDLGAFGDARAVLSELHAFALHSRAQRQPS